jgi:tRNA-splicing ligase RtcB
MIELQGKYNTAKVFTDNVENTAMSQIIELCNQEFVQGSKIRIMPDTHAGAGCTIGTTMTIKDKIVPNLVGVDIGCGMEVTQLKITKDQINFDQLDSVIRKFVPSGFSIRDKAHRLSNYVHIDKVIAPINSERAKKSIGTLGGGNHFIELNEGGDGSIYMVIHSGSRNLGKQVAEYYQDKAYEELAMNRANREFMINELKRQGRHSEISEELKRLSQKPKISKQLAYLEGQGFKDYMHDMEIAQTYAEMNRIAMMMEIVREMGWEGKMSFTTIHNYIDMDNMIMRKGAISAAEGELVIIPINMRDGSILAKGKGNEDWNYSGPHGAGRILSRSKAKELVNLQDFKDTMKDVWTTSVGQSTVDESPFAYKSMDEILSNITDSVDVLEVIKPLYNFKASE